MKALLDRDALVFNPPMLGCVLFLSGFPGGGSRIYNRTLSALEIQGHFNQEKHLFGVW